MAEKKIIQTDEAPQAIGPYSQAVKMGPFVYTSGQIPLTKDGSLIEGDVQAQTKQVLENVTAVLKAAGCEISDVIKTTVFIDDMSEFQLVNEVYERYFADTKPARSCVEVAGLPKQVKVEIECIAYLSE
ncbi:RidA family protein [Caldalkalibacillus salinus]|uniref:RidA family protein n=1 Tax=Caldalkalibacillus salinus TaxID=2803787 RepID=UPI00192190F0|nr:RidA family protein [Caldalkalibacillus salinus]